MGGEILSIFIIIVSLIFLSIGIVLLLKRQDAKTSSAASENISALLSKINDLETQLKQKNSTIEEQNLRNNLLLERVSELESRIKELEILLYGAIPIVQNDLNVPKMLLITVDPYIQQQDEISLNKAGMNFRRISNATKEKIENELRRARMQRRMYKYIMISGHSDEYGYQLSNGAILDSYWINTNLAGVEILFLNGCKTVDLADDAVGVAKCVISLLEDVDTDIAQAFSEAFWREIVSNKTVNTAYEFALGIEPSIKPYIDIRFSGQL